jgi:hypothetical protein
MPSALVSIDTNFILDQAAARLGASIPVVRTEGVGSVRHFAPTRVANELAWNHSAAARRRGVNPDKLLEVVNDKFMPRIRFVDMPPVDLPRDERLTLLNGLDRDDLDVGYLGLLLSPSHVFSHDKHLRMSGFAPPTVEDLNTILAAGLAVEVSDGALVATGFGVRITGAGAGYAANSIAIRLQIPVWVIGLVAAILFGLAVKWALSTPERRDKAGRALMAVAAEAGRIAERRALGQAVLEETSLEAPFVSLESRVFRTLAVADDPLLAREVQAAVDPTGDIVTEREVRDFMSFHPSFVRIGRYRWQLGRQLTIRRLG